MVGLILQAQGKNDEAQKRYERLVDLNPRAAVASNNLAWMYASRGEQLDKALQLAQAAKAELPDHPDVNDTLGYVYLKKQLPSLAIQPFRFALEKAPDNPAFHYHLGLAYAQAGDKAAARLAMEKALKLKADFEGADEARSLLRTLG
jgi:Flp pilus assembly protein TadD